MRRNRIVIVVTAALLILGTTASPGESKEAPRGGSHAARSSAVFSWLVVRAALSKVFARGFAALSLVESGGGSDALPTVSWGELKSKYRDTSPDDDGKD